MKTTSKEIPMTGTSIHSNLQAGAYRVRRLTHEGRQHLVAPVVVLVEGVHAGLSGPLFYSASELARSAKLWNGVPVPVFHPMEGGAPVSCNTPEAIEGRTLGRLYNAGWDARAKKVRAEIWVDVEKAARVPGGREILETLTQGRALEVSSGLFSEDDGTPGEFRGQAFSARVKNIAPDHLALLPGGQGACSFSDGCGVRANGRGEKPLIKKEHPMNCDEVRKALEEVAVSGPGRMEKSVFLALARAAGVHGLLLHGAPHEGAAPALQALVDAMDPDPSHEDGPARHLVWSVSPESFVYAVLAANAAPRFFSRDYRENPETGEAELAGVPREVRLDARFLPLSPEPATAEEGALRYLEAAPPEAFPVLNQGMALFRARKDELVRGILANPNNRFPERELAAMDLTTLEKMEPLARRADYQGQGGSPAAPPREEVPRPPAVWDIKKCRSVN